MTTSLYKKGIVFFIIICFIGSAYIPITIGISRDNTSHLLTQIEGNKDGDFDSEISFYMRIGHMPSLSACIIKNNSIAWYGSYGYCNRNERKIPTEDTIYMVASISKSITAIAILQLYEKGFFELDDNVNNFLPFELKNPKFPQDNITFRMLMAHQSSIQEKNKVPLPIYFTFLGYSFDWFDEFLIPGGGIYNENVWSDEPPGKSFSYTSINTVILGYIVEKISNQSFNNYCQDHIFKPLQMLNSSFHLGDFNYLDIAIPYLWIPGYYIPLPHIDTGRVCHPAGGLRTSISDLSNYLIAHMNNCEYFGKRILQQDTIAMMHSVQYPESFDSNFQYCLCWCLQNKSGFDTYGGHSGGIIGGRSEMWYRLFDKMGVIYFWNQYEYINLGNRKLENWAQTEIDRLLWEKADSL